MPADENRTAGRPSPGFPHAEWLRQEGKPRDGMDEGEADWCSKMNGCADEIERLRKVLGYIATTPPDYCPGDTMEDSYAHIRSVAAQALEGSNDG